MSKKEQLFNPLWKLPVNILFYLGSFITFFGLIGYISSESSVELIDRTKLIILFGVTPALIGFVGKYLLKANVKKINRIRSIKNLEILFEENEEITVPFVVERLNVKIREAKKLLEILVKNGSIQSELNESGILVYIKRID